MPTSLAGILETRGCVGTDRRKGSNLGLDVNVEFRLQKVLRHYMLKYLALGCCVARDSREQFCVRGRAGQGTLFKVERFFSMLLWTSFSLLFGAFP